MSRSDNDYDSPEIALHGLTRGIHININATRIIMMVLWTAPLYENRPIPIHMTYDLG